MNPRWWQGRPLALEVCLVLVAGLIGGLLGALVAIAAAVAVELGVPARRLPLYGLCSVGVAALAWIVGNAGRWDDITFELVTANPWPNRFALAAVVLLMVGVALDVRATLPRGDGPTGRGSGETNSGG